MRGLASPQVALDAERAAHANAVAQRDAAAERCQAMDEQAQLVRPTREQEQQSLGLPSLSERLREPRKERITPPTVSTPHLHVLRHCLLQEHEEIEAAIVEFERIARQERQRADAAESALVNERAAFRALREADLELERRTSMAEPPASEVASDHRT